LEVSGILGKGYEIKNTAREYERGEGNKHFLERKMCMPAVSGFEFLIEEGSSDKSQSSSDGTDEDLVSKDGIHLEESVFIYPDDSRVPERNNHKAHV
jgi:hypothetical protein